MRANILLKWPRRRGTLLASTLAVAGALGGCYNGNVTETVDSVSTRDISGVALPGDPTPAEEVRRVKVIRDVILAAQPKKQFVEVEQLGELAVFFCSPAGNNVRGVAWNMDGGWAAQ